MRLILKVNKFRNLSLIFIPLKVHFILTGYNGAISTGYITLCNAQGPNLIYEPGNCSIEIQGENIVVQIVSDNPDFLFEFSDTTSYQCQIREGIYRVFNLYNLLDTSYMGTIQETQESIFFIIEYPPCINSSVFEGAL